VLLNQGSGALAHQRDYGGGGSVGIGDLNGDGRPDLATTSGLGVSVLLNGGDGRFQPRLDYGSGSGGDSAAVAIGELNGDRRLDLAVANTTLLHNDAPSDLAVLINTPGLCNVQYVKGLALAAAKRTLARLRCRVGKVTRAYSKVKRGRVILQKPKFGAVRPGGAKVDLVISKGRNR
jgi:hypothetical protein